jgi:hypothetical protein
VEESGEIRDVNKLSDTLARKRPGAQDNCLTKAIIPIIALVRRSATIITANVIKLACVSSRTFFSFDERSDP